MAVAAVSVLVLCSACRKSGHADQGANEAGRLPLEIGSQSDLRLTESTYECRADCLGGDVPKEMDLKPDVDDAALSGQTLVLVDHVDFD